MAGDCWYDVELGCVPYPVAAGIQETFVLARITGTLPYDVVLWMEHPPVYTLGLRGGRENLLVSAATLAARNITVVQTKRGGDITYHGPGQLVAYPIIDLDRKRMGVDEYVRGLESVMLKTAVDFGVIATRNAVNRGVWVNNRKLGSIGIAIRKRVSYHGFALNVNIEMTPFRWINPCGLAGISMTSLQRETRKTIRVAAVRQSARKYLAAEFGGSLRPLSLAQAEAVVGRRLDVHTGGIGDPHRAETPSPI